MIFFFFFIIIIIIFFFVLLYMTYIFPSHPNTFLKQLQGKLSSQKLWLQSPGEKLVVWSFA